MRRSKNILRIPRCRIAAITLIRDRLACMPRISGRSSIRHCLIQMHQGIAGVMESDAYPAAEAAIAKTPEWIRIERGDGTPACRGGTGGDHRQCIGMRCGQTASVIAFKKAPGSGNGPPNPDQRANSESGITPAEFVMRRSRGGVTSRNRENRFLLGALQPIGKVRSVDARATHEAAIATQHFWRVTRARRCAETALSREGSSSAEGTLGARRCAADAPEWSRRKAEPTT